MTEKANKQGKIDALLGRALRDKEFRQKLVDDPKGQPPKRSSPLTIWIS